MAWSERQTAMLQAMGLRLFQAPSATVSAAAMVLTDAPATATLPAQSRTPLPLPVPVPALAAASDATAAAPQRRAPEHQTVVVKAPLSEAQAAVSDLDWPALRQAVAQCRACGLCEGRQQTVFGAGHPQAHWMVIGEAPGAQEDAEGEPFVGAAGQLLDNMLRALGLSRAAQGDAARSVYIANTLKCRPPGNRNPKPDELSRCEPFLLRQIELLQPRIILAMGRFAVQALLRSSEPVGRLRGRVHAFQGVPLVVTYHPAYLLRNLPDKARAWEDLCLAARVAEAANATRLG